MRRAASGTSDDGGSGNAIVIEAGEQRLEEALAVAREHGPSAIAQPIPLLSPHPGTDMMRSI